MMVWQPTTHHARAARAMSSSGRCFLVCMPLSYTTGSDFYLISDHHLHLYSGPFSLSDKFVEPLEGKSFLCSCSRSELKPSCTIVPSRTAWIECLLQSSSSSRYALVSIASTSSISSLACIIVLLSFG